jgi:hypothetical protein
MKQTLDHQAFAWYQQFVLQIIATHDYKWTDILFDALIAAAIMMMLHGYQTVLHTPLRNVVGLPVVFAFLALMLFRVTARLHARILVMRS